MYYGCADLRFTGKQALAPYTTQCVGIDLSEGMISAYNNRAENQV
jgi:ubiquinone/menaquinone biosynthesis C-methylase UbiE